MRDFDHSLAIEAPPTRILDAFFDADALASWWHVTRSLCLPRSLGCYAVEWPTTRSADDVLGRLGGAFRGTVVEFKPGREFFVGDAYWLPPDGEPIGPMALEASCTDLGGRAILRVRQSGWENSRRWNRFYEILAANFTESLDELKQYVESRR
ncbi:MAG TPA: SRPBCC domain-containing protein [Vicinamibacterales bacterium]|nr:SRPBCC domain-containing protein [Vicinamibacterales bacterium]